MAFDPGSSLQTRAVPCVNIFRTLMSTVRARSACVSGKRLSTAEATRVPSRHDETGSFRVVGAAVAWARSRFPIGGIAGTQELLDLCARKNILPSAR